MSYQIIKDICEKRLNDLGLNKKDYTERLNKEINAIQNQNMSLYLLDCVEKTKKTGKVKNTNNMLVTFLLGISDEDPIKNNKELIKTKYEEFPDIDSDFEDAKRTLVKGYLIEKYGEKNVASIIAFGKNKAKNTIKDVGRVKNINFEEINKVTKHLRGGPQPDTIEDGYNKSTTVKDFFDKYHYLNLYNLCRKIEGNVRQATKHAAGVVVSPIPLTDVVGLQFVNGEITTCWEEGIESKELSKVGLIKLDILGLNTLTIFNETCKYIKKLHGVDIDLTSLDLEDVNVLKGFFDANTVGIFQFEKPELRNLMKKVKISCFSDISAINALNRPGPLDTGMDEKFWKVKNGVEKTKYLHPKLEPILKDTYTVILYQEQLIKIVQELAGMTADEADNFRRVLTKEAQAGRSKGINPLEKYEKQFIDGCIERGVSERIEIQRDIHDDSEIPSTAKNVETIKENVDNDGEYCKTISCNVEVADEIFYQMKSFAGYGFNKCLTGETRVKFVDYSTSKVSTLLINKEKYLKNLPDVLSFDESADKIIPNRIKDVTESGIQDVYLLTTKSNKHIACTSNHKIRTNNGWKELGNIGINDKILIFKNEKFIWDEILSIKYRGKEKTYDITLEDQSHPYFFANNIGVHNSHSTAYAYLAFQGMYLKTYFPKEFMSILLTYTPNSVSVNDNINYFINYIEEARRMNLNILPPDINKSMKEFTIDGDDLLSGFIFVKGIGENPIKEIISKRPYKNITDFLMKVDARKVNKTVFYALVYCGAFDQFLENKDICDRYKFINEFIRVRTKSKKSELKNLETKYSYIKAVQKECEVCGGEIFNSPLKGINIRELNKKYDADEKILNFKDLDRIEVGTTIRVLGKVEKFSIFKIGFVDVKNRLDKKTFLLWKDSLDFLESDKGSVKKMLLNSNSVITFLVKRNKDYNGKKSFVMDVNSIEPIGE